MTSIVLIRHGETDWNIEGRYQGQADPPLNNQGVQQAKKLTTELQDIGLDILYTSTLRRTKQTADIINKMLMIPVKDEPRLQEIHQGDWQTRLRSEIEDLYPELFLEWETDPWKVTPPGGEHLSEVQSRVYAAIDEILQNNEQKMIGLVTHRIPIALIKVRYQDMDPDIVRSIHLPNAYWEEIPIPPPVNSSNNSR